MFKLKSTSFIIALSVIFTVSGFSQKESIILYNSQPVKVELSEIGTIKSFIGLVPGYMVGFDLSPAKSAITIPAEEIIVKSEIDQNAGYAIVSTERVELKYKPNFATLDKELINKLNDIAARLKLDPQLRILITAYVANDNKGKLSYNRIASAIAYLGLKGISPDRIKSEFQDSSNLIDIVAINYLN